MYMHGNEFSLFLMPFSLSIQIQGKYKTGSTSSREVTKNHSTWMPHATKKITQEVVKCVCLIIGII